MERKTDLESVKRIAKGLLNVSVLETEYSPMIVSHPFTKCGIATILNGDDFAQLDITKSKENFVHTSRAFACFRYNLLRWRR